LRFQGDSARTSVYQENPEVNIFHFCCDVCVVKRSVDVTPSPACFLLGNFDIVRRVKRLSLVAATVLIAAVAAHAANVTGTWNAKVDLGSQTGAPTFILKQDGEKLTGTYSGALGEAPLTGTVKGDAVVFDFEASGAKVHYAGKLNADGTKIEGSVDYGGQASGTFTATKQAEKK